MRWIGWRTSFEGFIGRGRELSRCDAGAQWHWRHGSGKRGCCSSTCVRGEMLDASAADVMKGVNVIIPEVSWCSYCNGKVSAAG